jgi:nucleotide-binding universal stress UspA family protein
MATIVVGTDGSKGSEAALSEGFDLARRLGAKVLVVAVAAHVSDVLGGSVYKGKVSEHLNRARAALDAARTMAEEAGVEAEFEVFEGDAAEEIAMIAESRDADLVVVGTRGHGGIAGRPGGRVLLRGAEPPRFPSSESPDVRRRSAWLACAATPADSTSRFSTLRLFRG